MLESGFAMNKKKDIYVFEDLNWVCGDMEVLGFLNSSFRSKWLYESIMWYELFYELRVSWMLF